MRNDFDREPKFGAVSFRVENVAFGTKVGARIATKRAWGPVRTSPYALLNNSKLHIISTKNKRRGDIEKIKLNNKNEIFEFSNSRKHVFLYS